MATVKISAGLGKTLENRLKEVNNATTMLAIHNTLAKMCDPYVPFLEGPLSQTIEVSPQGVRYTQPYARYQYYGVNFNHTTEYHPLASAQWDKAMLQNKGDEFRREVEFIVRERLRKLHG